MQYMTLNVIQKEYIENSNYMFHIFNIKQMMKVNIMFNGRLNM